MKGFSADFHFFRKLPATADLIGCVFAGESCAAGAFTYNNPIGGRARYRSAVVPRIRDDGGSARAAVSLKSSREFVTAGYQAIQGRLQVFTQSFRGRFPDDSCL
jgi:hypothetical protein